MGIRIVESCGTLPTSLKDGNLIIYGYDNTPAASIPLPFKTKVNGPINNEWVKYPNVMVVTPMDGGLVLVMRYDGTYTVYTNDFRPKMFGKYPSDLWERFIHVDRMGCFKHIPTGYKKERLYDAFLIRYTQSKLVHYTCVSHPTCRQILNFNDPEVVSIFNKGLNLSDARWPAFGEFQDCLYFDDFHLIPCEEIEVNYSGLQSNILGVDEGNRYKWNLFYRRRSYAEVIHEYQDVFTPPECIREVMDVSYFSRFPRAVIKRDKEDVTYQMACIMNKHQDFLLACELNGYTILTVDDEGHVRYHNIFEQEREVIDIEGTKNTWVSTVDGGYTLVGYANNRVMEISMPTVIPRVPCRNGFIYIGNQKIAIPSDMKISGVPDVALNGFRECTDNNKSCVIYNEDFSYKIL